MGYDGAMSESGNESNASGQSDGDRDTPEVGLVPDEDLPEDLQPAENPLARDPDEDGDGDGTPAGGSGEGQADGLPDLGGPGAAG